MSADRRPLVIVSDPPLPAVSGGAQRTWNYLLAIDALGPADLVVLGLRDESELAPTRAALPEWSIRCVPTSTRTGSRLVRAALVIVGRVPTVLARQDLRAGVEAAAPWAVDRDLVIAIEQASARVAWKLKPRRLVVDLWDIESVKRAREYAIRRSEARGSIIGELRSRAREFFELRALRHAEHLVFERADAVTVCSEADRVASPRPEVAWVVPNGADVPATRPRRTPAPEPTVIYNGLLTYAPNVLAARRLAQSIAPAIRRSIPNAVVRLVGRPNADVEALHHPPEVVVTGFVDDMSSELAGAWVLVVALDVAGGTRLKILEAFANGLPVVSTTVGAEGIDAEHGVQILTADDDETLATLTARLLCDSAEREALAAAAFDLVRDRYDWRSIRADLSDRLGGFIVQRS